MFLTTNTKAMDLTPNFYIKSVTYFKTTPVAVTIVKFCENAHFSLKTTSFYEKLPLFTENSPPFIKNFGPPPYRKLQPLISAFIENSIFGNNRDPWYNVYSTKHKTISLKRDDKNRQSLSSWLLVVTPPSRFSCYDS